MMADSKGTILVVDDDRLVLATLAHGLSSAGYDVIDADNGDDAILLARERRPDLALLDIRMQGKSGFDVAAYLRDHLQIPFMFLSAFADDDTAAQVRALGAVAYLVKPLDIGQILPPVQTAIDQIRSRGAAASAGAAAPTAAPVPVAAVAAATASAAVPADPLVWMAVGVLMHRGQLLRSTALDHLHQLAAAAGRSPADEAQHLIEALEAASPGRASS